MYGNHPYAKALEIAQQKSIETGKQHIVLPSEDEPDKYTIGVPIKVMTGKEFIEKIKRDANGKD